MTFKLIMKSENRSIVSLVWGNKRSFSGALFYLYSSKTVYCILKWKCVLININSDQPVEIRNNFLCLCPHQVVTVLKSFSFN